MTVRSTGFVVNHTIAAARIGQVVHNATNISTNSAQFAINTELAENRANEGSHVNAFRHGLWQASITKKFGQSTAKQIGNAHEDNPFVNTSQRTFKGERRISSS